MVREETARSSPSSRRVFLISPRVTRTISAVFPSWVTVCEVASAFPLVEFDLRTTEVGTKKERSNTEHAMAARRVPILRNQWVKTRSSSYTRVRLEPVGQNA